MPGIKHLVECHCYLAIYKKQSKYLNHKFAVYSKIDSNGKVISKLTKCNNCDALHYITDIGKSELRGGKDQTNVTLSIDDISVMLPQRLANILYRSDCDISMWEHVLDIIDESRWGEHVVIKRDIINETQQVKILKILSNDSFKLSTETINNVIVWGNNDNKHK